MAYNCLHSAMGLPLLLLLLLVAAGCSGQPNTEPPNILALQWPENACKLNGWIADECKKNYWTIHGWWPPQDSNSNNGAYDVNQIKSGDVNNDLKEFWPDLSNKKILWRHEWNTHGKPAAQKLSVRQYFLRGLTYYRIVQKCTRTKPAAAKMCFMKLSAVKRCVIIYVNGVSIKS
ncbi:ribonuclease T2-like [Leucoraja erinacea]|uniref:ribonuclease T2-like n=1 Tax=Leucoraja erinaceus TaxID=7782 RepID=UPI002456171B|nr:ribonuclease T2-like [Leucoraja erinacea]